MGFPELFFGTVVEMRKNVAQKKEKPMTDPWDERYIYLHLVEFYGKCRCIYIYTPYMDPMGRNH